MQRVGGPWSRGSDALELVRHATARFGRDDLSVPPELVTAAALRDVVAVADVHRLAGCVGAGLADVNGVPREVADALTAAHRASIVRHLVAVRALGAIAVEFDRRDLRWLVMKGPVLASHHYRDTGARAYGDLDLLVHPADLPDATEVLEDAGYEHKIRNWPLARWFGAAEFQMRSGRVELDVHWHLLYAWYDRTDVAIDLDAVFERVRRVGVGELAVPTFDAVDTLVFLGLHASKSGCHRLVWLKDIERAISIDDPDLDEVVRRARAYRTGPRVGLPLSRSASLLSANVPDDVIGALLPGSLRVIDQAVRTASPQLRGHERDTLARWWSRSMRSSSQATAADLVHRTRRNLDRRRASWPGDESGDPEEKRRYVEEVCHEHTFGLSPPLDPENAFRIERVRRRRARSLAALLAADEPRTTALVAMLQSRRGTRVWVVRDRQLAISGLVGWRRLAADVWTASVHLPNVDAAASIAHLVDRSPARAVSGLAADVAPLVPHLSRATSTMMLPRFVVHHPVAGVVEEPDGRTRIATREDLHQLVDLYESDELAPVRTRWQLVSYVRRMLRDAVIAVYLDDETIVGAAALDPVTDRFCQVSHLTVRADHRRQGVAWELMKRSAAVAAELGIGAVGWLAPSNPMGLDHPSVNWSSHETHHAILRLREPRQFRGHTRIRRAYERVQPLSRRRPQLFRDPSNPDRSTG